MNKLGKKMKFVAICMIAMVMGASIITQPAMAVFDANPGFTFADPTDETESRNVDKILELIDNAKPSSTIQIAVYILNVRQAANKLIQAHKREVNVQLYVDVPSEETKKLAEELGRNTSRRSFILDCGAGKCGARANMHLKLYRFSETGRSKKVIVTGSTNLHKWANWMMYGDTYTTVDSSDEYWKQTGNVMQALKNDEAASYRAISTPLLDSYFFPSDGEDPVLRALRRIDCRDRPLNYINMFKWSRDERGTAFVRAVKVAIRDGCRFRIIAGDIREAVEKDLRDAGAHVINQRDDNPHAYTHMKAMVLGGRSPEVWTGTAHFSERPTYVAVEHVIRVKKQSDYDKAYAWHNDVWNKIRQN